MLGLVCLHPLCVTSALQSCMSALTCELQRVSSSQGFTRQGIAKGRVPVGHKIRIHRRKIGFQDGFVLQLMIQNTVGTLIIRSAVNSVQ